MLLFKSKKKIALTWKIISKYEKSALQKFAKWYTKKAQTKHLTNQALERLK